MATYTGQNMGAGRLDRVSCGLFLSTLSGIVVSAARWWLSCYSATSFSCSSAPPKPRP